MPISSNLNAKEVPIFPTQRSLYKLNKFNIVSFGSHRFTSPKAGSNLYQVLSLESENVSPDEIKKAYRSMVLQYHPDVCPPSRKEESTTRFVELQQAYEILSDPILRTKYDKAIAFRYEMEQAAQGTKGGCSCCSEQVWRNQLEELKRRSLDRMERKAARRM